MTDMKALSAEQKEELAAEYERIVAETADESAEYSLRHYRKMSHIIGERPTPPREYASQSSAAPQPR